MDRPEVIEAKIVSLKLELAKSKSHYEYELVCTSDWSEDMIGFFNMGNARGILTLLRNGEKLQYRHEVFGKFNVYMNPNGNRILVYNADGSELEMNRYTKEDGSTETVYKSPVNEETIMSYIIWYTGNWYKKINF